MYVFILKAWAHPGMCPEGIVIIMGVYSRLDVCIYSYNCYFRLSAVLLCSTSSEALAMSLRINVYSDFINTS